VEGYILGREIIFGKDELTLKLTGLVGFFALKQKIEIPYRLIKSIYVDYFDAPQWMIRMPGTSLSPLNIYEDSFKYGGEWYFLSYEHRVPLVIIELEGHSIDFPICINWIQEHENEVLNWSTAPDIM
jgi:hypothetical protein